MTELDAIQVLDGFCDLSSNDATLDGSIPIRAAQACAPFLEGNSYGLQVRVREPIAIEDGTFMRRPDLTIAEHLLQKARAVGPMLVARGIVNDVEASELSRLVVDERNATGRSFRIWTGWLVRARKGQVWRMSHAGNRKSQYFSVSERYVTDTDRFVPLYVTVTPKARNLTIAGEIATLGPLPADCHVQSTDLGRMPDVGRAHADFYNEAYFAEKKTGSTKKYRKEIDFERAGPEKGELTLVTLSKEDGESILFVRDNAVHVLFHNHVSFRATFDGHTLDIEPDVQSLADGAKRIEATWGRVYGSSAVERDRRALWYLTKYFTPHPPGEPWMFVKPWAFVKTSPGHCCLIDGIPGDGYEVLRGIIRTDQFHALPAVIALTPAPRPVEVPKGAPLFRAFAIPRSMVRATLVPRKLT